jgi:hypothetical protein
VAMAARELGLPSPIIAATATQAARPAAVETGQLFYASREI